MEQMLLAEFYSPPVPTNVGHMIGGRILPAGTNARGC